MVQDSALQQYAAEQGGVTQVISFKFDLLVKPWRQLKSNPFPSVSPQVRTAQHSPPKELSVQNVQTELASFPVAKPRVQVTASPSVFFLPHFPHNASVAQEFKNIIIGALVPVFESLPPLPRPG
jgi:hypothetical protein